MLAPIFEFLRRPFRIEGEFCVGLVGFGFGEKPAGALRHDRRFAAAKQGAQAPGPGRRTIASIGAFGRNATRRLAAQAEITPHAQTHWVLASG